MYVEVKMDAKNPAFVEGIVALAAGAEVADGESSRTSGVIVDVLESPDTNPVPLDSEKDEDEHAGTRVLDERLLEEGKRLQVVAGRTEEGARERPEVVPKEVVEGKSPITEGQEVEVAGGANLGAVAKLGVASEVAEDGVKPRGISAGLTFREESGGANPSVVEGTVVVGAKLRVVAIGAKLEVGVVRAWVILKVVAEGKTSQVVAAEVNLRVEKLRVVAGGPKLRPELRVVA